MKHICKLLSTFAIIVMLVDAGVADDKKPQEKNAAKAKRNAKKKRQRKNYLIPGIDRRLEKVKLDEKQAAKLKELRAKLGENIKKARKTAALSKEQRQARREASKAAKADGKKGKELRQHVNQAVKLTSDQQQAQKTLRGYTAEYRKAVLGLLSDEQKEKAGLKRKRGKKKRGKKKKGARKKKKADAAT